jgi:hypothetical protein
MKKNYSLIVLSENGSYVKEITFTRERLIGAGLILLVFLLMMFLLCYDLSLKKSSFPEIGQLEKALSQQTNEIAAQHHKIESFKNEIGRLSKDLQQLNQYEEKIKMIAGIEKSPDSDNHLVGIGGPMPVEHDPAPGVKPDHRLPVSKNHP